MEPGDWVMAIGNPFGLAHTVSVGVISATSRPFPVAEQRSANVLQTDAAINPGNSGGPLLNLRGEVIGVNTAIYSNGGAMGGAGNIGIGFAIPINTIRDVLPGLRAGKITRGRIGVSVRPVSPDEVEALSLKDRRGAVVAQVPPRSGGQRGHRTRRRHHRVQRQAGDPQRGSAADRAGHGAGHDGAGQGDSRRQGTDVQRPRRGARSRRPKRTVRQMRQIPGGDTGAGFGITLNNVTPEMARQFELPANTQGAVVTEVDPDSPAARVLQPGDVILQVEPQAGRERQRGEQRAARGAVQDARWAC